MLFIAEAFAQTAPLTDPNSTIGGIPSSIFQIVALVAIFYFLLIRPQMKKSKDQRQLITSLQKGDKVVTTSGIVGTISKVEPSDQTFVLEIAPQVKIKILQSFVGNKFNPDANAANSNVKASDKETKEMKEVKEIEPKNAEKVLADSETPIAS